ncbi:Bug family tripartite tricarboxylate transporter substrate binding protein [Variovorax ginsengisoli]|uniref:Tripartite tricarboxylate transporter substrate-binding protein n=1 Tax=Variovorax ginsengisoli TaxID=363844 RepID=A0ABT8S7J5_9BURK|nr:tripartite tricarboxylate transporter substrate-binding protein [Variovorax ginsengisoli]MDN8615089.1 tripartite tricarboxylate transporter substrate-binding protein [Variovorax ginsengisoli]MDO1534259.1 tripartite tricarboxylate transporter substrate-binding protein [Variovorax ginsengisoli]
MNRIFSLLIALVALWTSSIVSAQSYPNKPIRVIVPYQAGQGTDVATRYLAEHLGRALGQALVIENRAGAGGNIGAAEVARAAPDGYTLLMGTNGTHVLNQFLYPSMPFDPEKDFEPVALVSTFPMVILANPNAPYKTMADLLADAKARPDVVNVGLPSTTSRLVLELIQKQSGMVMRAVPYKGSGTSMTDLMGGQVLVAIDTASAARPFVASGKLKALAVTSLKDSPLLPGTPPAAGEGLEGFQVIAWNGLYAPHGTPAAIIQKLNVEIAKILALPEARQRLLELGHEAAGGTPDSLARFARTERDKWGPLVKSAGMKLE